MSIKTELVTSTGSRYRLIKEFESKNFIKQGGNLRLHQVKVPVRSDFHHGYYWNHNCTMSFVDTTTYIPYQEEIEATNGPATFILHNYLDYVCVHKYPDMKIPIDVMIFDSKPLCHDFRIPMLPTQPTNIVLGLLSSDIVVLDPLHGLDAYSHHNVMGKICSSPITRVKWVNQSHTEFLVAHQSGDVYFYDHTWKEESLEDMVEETGLDFPVRSQREDRMNPILHWKLSNEAIYDVSFSPDGKYLAAVGRDGNLVVVQYHLQRKIALMSSSFGALQTLAWSPDSKYVLTGGQDDMIVLWSLRHHSALVRCEGHRSWVTCVAVDDWFSSPTSLRFASVGEDGMLCFWDVALPEEHPEGDEAVPQPVCQTIKPSLHCLLFQSPLSQVVFHEKSITISTRDGTAQSYSRPSQDCYPDDVLQKNIPSYSIA
ncbi:WD repeat-containing protein 20 [Thraustotheca clavata]|uniref:WD repeat-containing protein 20 n=1 Tax=Thraustotheca clavata TaxID=74557 RepID=A0A1W0A1V5_9STRA|nr:WD repeat-containing protein 20 [Thraustotheca clavata]